MSLIMIAIVLARMYTRIFILRNVGLDDWLCLSAMVCLHVFDFTAAKLRKCITFTNCVNHSLL